MSSVIYYIKEGLGHQLFIIIKEGLCHLLLLYKRRPMSSIIIIPMSSNIIIDLHENSCEICHKIQKKA